MLKIYRRYINRFLILLLSILACIAIILAGIYSYMAFALPDVTTLNQVSRQHQTYAPFNTIPPALIHAVVATEDARFYSHPGIDLIGIARAAAAVMHSGRKVEGASTITMQVARNFYLSREKTYSRKIKEILLALKIDHALSKNKILEVYLNEVYFGNRAYGVTAAARVYYGKSLKALTLPESAMIAGLLQSPSRVNPIKNPTAALLRRNHVLKRMMKAGYITKKEYDAAILSPQ